MEIVNWETGQFCIKHGLVTDDINVTASTNSLLLDANKNTNRELTA
jgi:hypothetical protein